MNSCKKFIKQNFILTCLKYFLISLSINLKHWFGKINSDSGTTHQNLTLQDSLQYIENVFNDYKHYGKVTRFTHRIAEIGPGDNVGVALLMLNDNTTQIDLADKFFSKRNQSQQQHIYSALIQKFPKLQQIFNKIDLANDNSFPNIYRHYGKPAAAENFFKEPNIYNFIVSRSVFEHLDDPLLTLKYMISALTTGGKLIHKIDLRDHGMFSNNFHELKFYEINNFVYKLMTAWSGYPNRITINKYRDLLNTYNNLQTEFYITQLVGVGPLEPHRLFKDIPLDLIEKARQYVEKYKPYFSSSFNKTTTDDLIVAGFFMVVTVV